MNSKAYFFIIVLICSIGAYSTLCDAQNDSSLEEILEGFDTELPAGNNDELQDVLDGFDGELNPDDNEAEIFDDDILGGFEDNEELYAEPDSAEADFKPARVSLDGFLKFSSSYNFAHDAPEEGETDWRGFSRLKGELQLELGAKLSQGWRIFVSGKTYYDGMYQLRGRDEYTDDLLDEAEAGLDLRDTYLQGSLTKALDTKLGRQIVVWGKSDNIRVTDVLNPLELQEIGLTDIEDLRLPVTMAKFDYYAGDWGLSTIAIPEIRFHELPPFGSDFYPSTSPLPSEEIPATSLENIEYAFAASGVFSGWDLAFYYADFFDRESYLAQNADGTMKRKHARLNMFGAAYNWARGNWLLKAEAAYFDGFKFFLLPETYSRIDALFGLEYSGFSNSTLSLEAANRHLNSFDEILEQSPDYAQEDEFQSAVRVERNFWNETLTLTLLANIYGLAGEDGSLGRLSLQYDLTDAFSLTGTVALYQSGDLQQFQEIGENDRLFFEAKYHF